ncbi:hypothetical protein AAULR_09100, partial [Lacticaseibacillus rhamnosus MTCC 5462]
MPIEAIADGFHAADTTNQAEDSQTSYCPAMILPCAGLLQRRKQPASPM